MAHNWDTEAKIYQKFGGKTREVFVGEKIRIRPRNEFFGKLTREDTGPVPFPPAVLYEFKIHELEQE